MDPGYPHQNDPQQFVAWLFERLEEIPGIDWDPSVIPVHSSYGDWYAWGTRVSGDDVDSSHVSLSSRPASPAPSGDQSIRSISQGPRSVASTTTTTAPTTPGLRPGVVARISKQVVRLERQYQLGQSFIEKTDTEARHHLRSLNLFRLPARRASDISLGVMVVEYPGSYNDLARYMNFGPNWFRASTPPQTHPNNPKFTSNGSTETGACTLNQFMTFAIGASSCVELLHRGNKIIHGELRGDAFFFNEATGAVKWISYGTNVRSFEHGLTSAGWSALTREFGVEYKLQFIAPEQTGRLPAAPDSRTDIYSLGIVFYNFLTGQLPFSGDTPLEIMQNVLSRRITPVSVKRVDVPDALSAVIQKMVQRNIAERYHSATALKYDLEQIQKFLTDGDSAALSHFQVGSKDDNCVFNLPHELIGREAEFEIVLKTIQKTSKHLKRGVPVMANKTASPMSSSSSLNNARRDSVSHVTEDFNSDRSSTRSRSSFSQPNLAAVSHPIDSLEEQEENDSTKDSPKYHPRAYRLSIDTPASDFNVHSSMSSNTDDAVSMLRNPQRYKRSGRCDIITLTGVGKSSFIQALQPIARTHGYFCTAKFDSTGSTPFQPVLNLMSSLFRQIFSETDINTEFHNSLRNFCRPFWNLLHGMLNLPEWLMGANAANAVDTGTPVPPTFDRNRANTSGSARRPISPFSMRPSDSNSILSGHTTNDLIRGGPTAKNSRFMAIFVDVLRFLSLQKVLIFCLDDLQFADEESLDLLQSITVSKTPMILLLAYRESAALSSKCQNVLHSESAIITHIKLAHLTEDQVADYVAMTLNRSRDFVFPLVAIILEKTQGSPFFIREMLEATYREGCLWYSWDDSAWTFDVDRIFRVFESTEYGSQINNSFIVARIKRLAPSSRSLLAWAALIGNTFSFTLIKSLMRSGGFKDCQWPSQRKNATTLTSAESPQSSHRIDLIRQSSVDALQGLQICLENFLIMAGEDEDHFRFAHDRYQSAARSLTECSNVQEMHFSIAKAMISDERDKDSVYTKCNHICLSAHLLKDRVKVRRPYRDLLCEAASDSVETGGRVAGLGYYTIALSLLQEDAWNDSAPDVEYQETLDLYLRCAECYWFQGDLEKATALVTEILNNAKQSVDKVPAWILRSRVYVRGGDVFAAMRVLQHALTQFDVSIANEETWESCDLKSLKYQAQLISMPRGELIGTTVTDNDSLDAICALLCETIGSSFWVDSLLLYKLSLLGMDIILNRGATTQAGVLLTYFASTVISRFNNVETAWEISSTAKSFFHQYSDDYFSVGRGQNLSCILINHFGVHLSASIPVLENALMSSITCGDRIAAILNVAFTAAFRIWSSCDLNDVEHFCTYGAEELGDWETDVRGGAFIISVRQFCRALQGKTNAAVPSQLFTDEDHDAQAYCQEIQRRCTTKDRAWNAYTHFQMAALFLYGHHHAAIKLASPMQGCQIDDSSVPVGMHHQIEDILQQYWSSRFGVHTSYYLGLAYMAVLRDEPEREDAPEMLEWVKLQSSKFEKWTALNDVNFFIFKTTLDAQLQEWQGDLEKATRSYEAALDHSEVHGFIFDQALTSELYAEYLIRRGANRPAANAIKDAIASYRRVSAIGKADSVAIKHEWLLKGTSSLNKVDAGCQTSGLDTTAFPVQRDFQSPHLTPTKRLSNASQNQLNQSDAQKMNSQLESLDVIDITSILQSSEVLSSELQIERLLAKMTKIILDSAGGELCAIVVQDPEGEIDWRVAAISDREGNEYPAGESLDNVDDFVAKQITLYCLRFKETVFLNNAFNDDRFSNVSEAYRKRNPGGKSVIALPILHSDKVVRGCVYLEGPPGSFTRRNLAVLQLLVSPVSISITNAMLFKRVEKVSANNAVMVEAQKFALSQARIAEKKAKKAEAEAMRNARLKEEAAAAKSMFLASVSHELRTPLNGVIGMSELLKQTTLNSEQESYADSIRVCADTLLTVINDILDFSKLEAGKMRMFSVPLNLRETISEVVRALSYGNMEKDLRTVMELEVSEELLVVADPIRLHQVMMNLLSNAFKFCPSGTITVKAIVERETDDEIEVTCSVSDTGIGIAEEQKQKLFLPFSQADNSTVRTYGGTGLGLTICKAIIENLMKGTIWLDSEVNVGTTVSFRLTFQKVGSGAASQAPKMKAIADPMAVYTPEEESTMPTKESLSPLPAPIPRDKLRICIAEDNAINQRIAVSFVQKLGFRCDAYTDGRQAVDALAAAYKAGDPFSLVLMDCQMPNLDGYDATREIRKHKEPTVRDVVIIAMTASAIRGDREKCLEAGMNNYLAKPVRQQALKQMLDGYIDQSDRPETNNESSNSSLTPTMTSKTNNPSTTVPHRPKLSKRTSSTKKANGHSHSHSNMHNSTNANTNGVDGSVTPTPTPKADPSGRRGSAGVKQQQQQ